MCLAPPHSPRPGRTQMDGRRFVGLEAVPDAVEWLQSGRSMGKCYVQLSGDAPPLRTAAAAAGDGGGARARM